MRGINQVTILGNLGQDPTTRYTSSGTAITELSVATSEQWTDKQSGEKQERTEWHRITMFGKLAEIAGEYCSKGGQVFIQGKIQTDKYTDKEGIERYSTKIIADTMQLLGGRPSGERGNSDRGNHQSGKDRSGNHGMRDDRPAQKSPPEQNSFADDEIPF
jgi:single-strand DNA-binding protein